MAVYKDKGDVTDSCVYRLGAWRGGLGEDVRKRALGTTRLHSPLVLAHRHHPLTRSTLEMAKHLLHAHNRAMSVPIGCECVDTGA